MDLDDADGIDFDDILSETLNSAQVHPEAAKLEEELQRQASLRTLAVPTKDADVRLRLRALQQPTTLFGERPENRRDRLKEIVSKQLQTARQRAEGQDVEMGAASDSQDSEEGSESENEQEFYTPGGVELLQERKFVAGYSLKRARKRLEGQKRQANIPLGALLDRRKAVYAELKTYTNLGTQLADDRPISAVRFAPNSKMLATGSWSGTVKLWDVPTCNCLGVFKGHGVDRIGGLAWHPEATLTQSASTVNLVSGGADGNICLWSLDKLSDNKPGNKPEPILNPLSTLKGHSLRVCRVAFHPSGRTLASASYDETWRLWDVEHGKELLIQEGHSHEVYAVAFQPDGALICSGGLDAIGRVWDLRSGNTTMVLDGHVKDILAIDFHPNGYQIATGSNDDTVRIWDMRQLKSIYTIAAHSSTVSDLKFFSAADTLNNRFPFTLPQKIPQSNSILDSSLSNGVIKEENEEVKVNGLNGASRTEGFPDPPIDGMYLATCGYDGQVKFWSSDDWQLIKSISSEQGGKVMSVDLSRDGKFMATGEWGRTFKLLAAQDISI